MIILIALPGCRPLSTDEAEVETQSGRSEAPAEVDEDTNIHYTGRYCDECHYQRPAEGGDKFLKFNGDYDLLCRCHHGMSPGYCHPLEVETDKDVKPDIPDGFPLKDSKFTCNTCHDVYRQCQQRLFDRYSLRGAPYRQKTDFCYHCHEREYYEKLNAHNQLKSNGELKTRMCLYCHEQKPDEKTATYEDVSFIGDMKILCRRCHQIEGNHSGDFDHMAVQPSEKALERMEEMKTQYNMILPLTKDGRMTCITCHNPHEKGVIPEDKPSAKGAGSQYRHRLPGELCRECHRM